MYIRKEGKYHNLEHKKAGKLILRMSVKRVLKILVAFKRLDVQEQNAFFEMATKKRPLPLAYDEGKLIGG